MKRFALLLTMVVIVSLSVLVFAQGTTGSVLQLRFDPVEVKSDQTSHILFNNTNGGQKVHVEIFWRDDAGVNTVPFEADVDAGHGVNAQFPDAVGNGGPLTGLIRLSQAPGAPPLPSDIATRVGGTFEVVNSDTGHVAVALGLAGAPTVFFPTN